MSGVIPDEFWLLSILSTIRPQHLIFDKAYRAPKGNSRRKEEDDEEVDIDPAFLANLPPIGDKDSKQIVIRSGGGATS